MVLTDMGVEYSLYCSDITVTLCVACMHAPVLSLLCSHVFDSHSPSNGKYTEDQKVLYNSVLNAGQSLAFPLRDISIFVCISMISLADVPFSSQDG